MKIAQVAPLYESAATELYGGNERIISYLSDALVDMGHDVTLFAAGGAVCKAKLVPTYHIGLRLGQSKDPVAMHILQLQEVIERAHKFDIIHFHTDYLHFPVSRLLHLNTITTLHNRLDIPELKHVYSKFLDAPVISVSNVQRRPLPMARWAGTIYHGLPGNLYCKGNGEGDYVLFIGHISPEKGLDHALEIAAKANMKIKVVAKVDEANLDYYEQKVKPLLRSPHVEFLGEVGESIKVGLIRDAKALLFPIRWSEPCGIMMIEALACGTPVVAYRNGVVPEIITHEKTGYIVTTQDEAVNAILQIHKIDRNVCRQEFDSRFDAVHMAQNYVAVYNQLIKPRTTTIQVAPDTYKAFRGVPALSQVPF
jgi:glycosyltransferase involved in cell wall biosynthesis